MRGDGLRHLAIALAVAGVVGTGDWITGKHLWHGVSSFAGTLSTWYDAKREPGYPCIPRDARPYTALSGIVFETPGCWTSEVSSFLGREVHRFRDPDAQVGTVSVSVEPIVSEEDRQRLIAEFETLSSRPGAVVDSVRKADPGAPETDEEEDDDAPAGGKDRVTGSLAEKLERGERERAAASVHAGDEAAPAGGSADGPSSSGGGLPAGAAPSATGSDPSPGKGPGGRAWVHSIRTRGELGATAPAGAGTEPTDAAYPRRVWSWLLIGDRVAVHVTYSVRQSWIEDSEVADEFEVVRGLVDSIRPVS